MHVGYEEISGNSTVIHVRFPKAATFKLIVYAKETKPEDADAPGLSTRTVRETVYGAVCEYKLVSSFVLTDDAHVPPLPLSQSLHYGPNEISRRYGITPDVLGCLIKAPNGMQNILNEYNLSFSF